MEPADTSPVGYVLTKEQKIGAALLLLFGVMAIALGILQVRNTLYAPFALNKEIPAQLKDQVDTPDALRWRDTDRDRLNDFEELYVYTTSPYLGDTDSDGVLDSDEVKRGSNPLCGEGRNCTAPVASAGVASPISSTGTLFGTSLPELGPEPMNLDLALQDPAQIRLMLQGVGMDPEVLKQISDPELLVLVREVINVSNTPFNFPNLAPPATTTP